MKTRHPVPSAALILVGLGFGGLLLTACIGGGSGNSGFSKPLGVVTSPQGNIYVLDAGNSRVVELSPAGKELGVWNTNPKHYGDNDEPGSLLVDRYGNVYVTASGCVSELSGSCPTVHDRQEVFSAHGRLLLQTASFTFVGSDPYGSVYTCSARRFQTLPVRRLPAAACSSSTPFLPGAWIVDTRGRLLASNGGLPCPCVSVLFATGTWGRIDVGNTFNGEVQDFAVDRSGNIYATEIPSSTIATGGGVADRVAKIAPNGTVRAVWTGFTNLSGVAVGNDGSVYVTDEDQNQVDKLSANGKRLAAWSGPKG
jgi:tripartite motif-containing protein 71